MIIDMVMENEKVEDESLETQTLFAMLMMILVTGQERNEKEWARLFSDAGFTDYKITPVPGLRSIIEVFPCVSLWVSFSFFYIKRQINYFSYITKKKYLLQIFLSCI